MQQHTFATESIISMHSAAMRAAFMRFVFKQS